MPFGNGSGIGEFVTMTILGFNLTRYLKLYSHILSCTFKSLIEYRLNFVVQLIYGPAYNGMLYLILQTALSKTPSLGGWNHDQIMVLFTSFHLFYTTCIILFVKSVRYLLAHGVRTGEVDMIMTKPVSVQFYLTFQKPELQQLLLWISLLGFFIHSLWGVRDQVSLLNFAVYLLSLGLGFVTAYGVITGYAASGFVVNRVMQVMELFDKVADFSQYPTPIFPETMQMVLYTLIPIGFFGYVPVLFLLGRGSLFWFVAMVVAAGVSALGNRLAWNWALKQYSSASS